MASADNSQVEVEKPQTQEPPREYLENEKENKLDPGFLKQLEARRREAEAIAKRLEEHGGEEGKKIADQIRDEVDKTKKKKPEEWNEGFLSKILKALFKVLASLIQQGKTYEYKQLQPVQSVLSGAAEEKGIDVAEVIGEAKQEVRDESREAKKDAEKKADDKEQNILEVFANAAIKDPETRLSKALSYLREKDPETWKDKQLSEEQKEAILAAHEYHIHEESQVFAYTSGEILGKYRILTYGADITRNDNGEIIRVAQHKKPENWDPKKDKPLFTREEIQELMDKGIVGNGGGDDDGGADVPVLTPEEREGLSRDEYVRNAYLSPLENTPSVETAKALKNRLLSEWGKEVPANVASDVVGVLDGLISRWSEGTRNALAGFDEEFSSEFAAAETGTAKLAVINQQVNDLMAKINTGEIDQNDPAVMERLQKLSALANIAREASMGGRREGRGNQQALSPEQAADKERTVRQKIEHRIDMITGNVEKGITATDDYDRAALYFNELRRWVNFIVENERRENITGMDRTKRDFLRRVVDTNANQLSLEEIVDMTQQLKAQNIEEYFSPDFFEQYPEENLPTSLQQLMTLIMSNAGEEYRQGGEKQLVNALNEVQYENLMDWVRDRILEAHNNNPTGEINPLTEVNVPSFYTTISLLDMVTQVRYGRKEIIEIKGEEGGRITSRIDWEKDADFDNLKWKLLTEGWLYGLIHNWDVLYVNTRGSEEELWKTFKAIYGKVILTRAQHLLKLFGLPGRSNAEFHNFVDNLEQGRVGQAIQHTIVAYNHMAELVMDEDQTEGGNQFKQALGTEGMKTFWRTMAAQVLTDADKLPSNRVTSRDNDTEEARPEPKTFKEAYKDFVVSMLREELTRYNAPEYAGHREYIQNTINDAITDAIKKKSSEYAIEFENIADLTQIRIKIARRVERWGRLSEEERRERERRVREITREHVTARVKNGFLRPAARTEMARQFDITEAEMENFLVNDEAFAMPILNKIRNIQRDQLSVFQERGKNEYLASLLRKGISNAVCRNLWLEPKEIEYAEKLAFSMTSWTGIAAKNDIGAKLDGKSIAFDAFSKVLNEMYYRDKQWENSQPGNKQNIPMVKHGALSFFDWLLVSEEGKNRHNKSFMDLLEGGQGVIGSTITNNEKLQLHQEFKPGDEKHYGEVYLQNVKGLFDWLCDVGYINFHDWISLDKDGTLLIDPEAQKKFNETLFKPIRYTENTPMNYNNNIRTWDWEFVTDPETGKQKRRLKFKTVQRRQHIFGKDVIDMGMDEGDKMQRSLLAALIAAELLERQSPDGTVAGYSYDFVQLIEAYFRLRGTDLEYDDENNRVVARDKFYDRKQWQKIAKKGKSTYRELGLPQTAGLGMAAGLSGIGATWKTFWQRVFSNK